MIEETPELLPLGTAVRIKGDDSLYFLIARGFQRNGEDMVAGYIGVPHPYGQSPRYKNMTFGTQDILEVVQRGYENELDKDFAQTQLRNAPDAPKSQAVSPEEDFPQNVSPAAVEKAPPVNEALQYPNDPFYPLKHKNK